MSDLTLTPTRQMAQAAHMKAQDAYAAARQADERAGMALSRTDDVAGLTQRLAQAERAIGVLQDAIDGLMKPAPRRKAA